ncbi:MAG: hypothetical protein C4576_21825 [Desulfobacteraceae bacterium]|nr:MAG: hypothetical protein C4576_21825 [Desulfobacteraceae bacterium]
MIQDKAYEFMVKYTPQREWIEERGMLLWLSTFFVEVGAAAFIFGALLGSAGSMIIGMIMCAVVGGGLHLADLGRPLRFWRILLSSTWKTSWIVRGIWSINLFVVFGAMYLALALAGIEVSLLLILAVVFALCTILYFGFLLSYVKGIALWNNGLLPILVLVISLWGGLNVFALYLLLSGVGTDAVRLWSWIFPVLVLFTLFFYLMGVRYRGTGGGASFNEFVSKRRGLFWVGIVLLGLVFPATVKLIDAFASGLPGLLVGIAVLLELGANLSLRYCIFKCALYEPVISDMV